jgi:hypothetical protein
MPAFILITGTLFRDPERPITNSGSERTSSQFSETIAASYMGGGQADPGKANAGSRGWSNIPI